MNIITLIDKLYSTHNLSDEELALLLNHIDDDNCQQYIMRLAQKTAQAVFGNKIYIRGLIEFSNYCKNDCYYCGIRCSNNTAIRYRLTSQDILSCCKQGYALGFRSFVLQGGEDYSYSDTDFAKIISSIKSNYSDCALTLSVGERSYNTYKSWYDAGADRYLLRHETANALHYSKLHPQELSLHTRQECLWFLKDIGYQVGSGFMVGSPYQTKSTLLADLLFIKKLRPQMIGIGPFIAHHATPFADKSNGSLKHTLFLLSLLRLLFPYVLLPSTTALGTIDSQGRQAGILAGANVVMPNLSPIKVRENYLLYDNKLSSGAEAAESLALLQAQLKTIGYDIAITRGDYKEAAAIC